MKTTNFLLALTAAFLLALATACTDSNLPADGSPDTNPGMPATITATLSDDDPNPTGNTAPQTRLKHESEGTGLNYPGVKVSWTVGDAFMLFATPVENTSTGSGKAEYKIKAASSITNGGKTATFTKQTTDATLTGTGHALYPSAGARKADRTTAAGSWADIVLSMEGQKQTGNDNYTHLAAYDYMTAELATLPGSSTTTKDPAFHHLPAMMTVKITGVPTGYSPAADGSNDPMQLYMDVIADDVTTAHNFYRTVSATAAHNGLPFEESQCTRGSAILGLEGITWSAANGFTAHLMMFPINLTGKKFTVSIRCKDGTTYRYTTPQIGKQYAKAMRYTAEIAGGDNWQKVEATAQAYNASTTAATAYAGGEGSMAAPYLISNAAELKYFQEQVNTQGEKYEGKYFRLATDIKITTTNDNPWVPIGYRDANYFSGNFDGGGHTISGTIVTGVNSSRVGFFGVLENKTSVVASVCNLHIKADVTVGGDGTVGGLVGNIKRGYVISGCSYKGSMTSVETAQHQVCTGGLVGECYKSTLINCSVEPGSKIKGSHVNDVNPGYSNNSNVGGIVGLFEDSEMTSCTNHAQITGGKASGFKNTTYNYTFTGGLIGRVTGNNASIINHCKNYGTVTGGGRGTNSNNTSYTGGLIGRTDNYKATVHDCHNLGASIIKGENFGNTDFIGGLVGRKFSGSVYSCCTNKATVGGEAPSADNRLGFNSEFAYISECEDGHPVSTN